LIQAEKITRIWIY